MNSGGSRRRNRADARLIPLLLIVTVLAFLPVFGNGFVDYDDEVYLTQNGPVRQGLSPATVRWAFGTGHTGNWHPLTWISHLLDVSVFGLNPAGHHAVSVLLHAASAAVLFLALRWMTGWSFASWLVAALFAVHPLHVESVAWAAERKDVLSGLFFMLTLLAWTKYVRGGYYPLLPLEGGGRVGVWAKESGFVIHPPPTPPLKGGEQEPRGHDPNSSLEIRGHDLNSGNSEMGIVSPRTVSSAHAADSSNSQGHDPHFQDDGNGVMSRNCRGMGIVSPRTHDDGIEFTSRSFRWYALSLTFFTLGLLSKPMLVTLPFVLLLLDWWPLGRLAAPGGGTGKVAWRRLGQLVQEKLPFLLLAAASSVVTYLVQKAAGAVRTADFYPFGVRLGNAVTAMAAYLGKTVLPVALSVSYPHPRAFPPVGRFAVAAAVLLVFFLLAILARRSRPHLFTGWLWFAGTLVPVIGLVQVGAQAMADRYTYLPLIGIFLALAGEWEMFASGSRPRRRAMTALAVAVVVVLGVLTMRQAGVWRNAETLFRHATEVTKNNWTAHLNLGMYLNRQGRGEEGRRHFQEALRIRPDYGRTHQRLGIPAPGSGQARPVDEARMMAEQGKLAEAEAALRKILAGDPSAAEARYILALVLSRGGRQDEAAVEYRELLRSGTMASEAANNLGVIESRAGRLDAAEPLFRQAVEAGPGNAEARNNLGSVLSRQGRLEEAAVVFGEALALRPNYLSAMLNLAETLRAAGHPVDAARWYRAALAVDGANELAKAGLAATGEQR